MKFKDAFKIAMGNDSFRKHHENVVKSVDAGVHTGCMIFAIDGECFYYGFDGVDLHKGRMTERRSEILLSRNECLIIR